jgi:hypothetical protein
MNTFKIVRAEKLGIHGKNGISKVKQNRVEKRINEILHDSNMKFYHKITLMGLGCHALVMTNKEITRDFAENLFDSTYTDCLTGKPVFKLPRNWKMID